MRVHLHTFGCKANQYDTECMRQELEARGAAPVDSLEDAEVVVVNTCTVTNQADAQARRFIRRAHRQSSGVRIVVAGCSSALHSADYARMVGVTGVVRGHDPVAVAAAVLGDAPAAAVGTAAGGGGGGGVVGPGRRLIPGDAASLPRLVQLSDRRSLDRLDTEPVGGVLLRRREAGTRGWLKIQDGCDRKCAFCATRLARGASRSRPPEEVLAEARILARHHPELVLTGIHIGHYGHDLPHATTLSRLVARLLEEVPGVRFRLGSVEATEIDELLLHLLATAGGDLAPHLHMPLQSGADPVLRRMRRWHTREQYRRRALDIVDRLPTLGLGADIITGFPGETDEDHALTAALVEELPYTYLHVFPFSPRDDTAAEALNRAQPVAQRIAGERSRDLRERVQVKADGYRRARAGQEAVVVLEGGAQALTGDYLRVRVDGSDGRSADAGDTPSSGSRRPATGAGRSGLDGRRLHRGILRYRGEDLYIDLSSSPPFSSPIRDQRLHDPS